MKNIFMGSAIGSLMVFFLSSGATHAGSTVTVTCPDKITITQTQVCNIPKGFTETAQGCNPGYAPPVVCKFLRNEINGKAPWCWYNDPLKLYDQVRTKFAIQPADSHLTNCKLTKKTGVFECNE